MPVQLLYQRASYTLKREKKRRVAVELIATENDGRAARDPIYHYYVYMLRAFYRPYGSRERDIARMGMLNCYFINSLKVYNFVYLSLCIVLH